VFRIAQELAVLQLSTHNCITAEVVQSGMYCHANATSIDVGFEDLETEKQYFDAVKEGEVRELLRDFMRYIYKRLEEDHNYLTSEEAIIETIEANEYIFDEDGDIVS
jgi:hypothetical protein